MPFKVLDPGLIEVTYKSREDLAVTAQAGLLKRLELECAQRPTVVVFDVGNIGAVPIDVPEFWLSVTKRLSPGLSGMAIVSPSLAVRVAADGFSIANVLRRLPIAVQSFTQMGPAVVWARQRLVASARAPAPAR